MKTISILTAAIVGIAASTANAEPAATTKPEVLTSASAATAVAGVDNRRYCIVETPTGSHIPRRQCHTRTEWADRGVDVDAR